MEYATAYIKDQEFTGMVDLKNAFLRGSAFNNLYEPYKDFEYVLPNSNQELKNIQAISFILLDLGLFLDTHPNNEQVIKLYNEYNLKLAELITAYEKDFSPLTLRSSSLNEYPWAWLNEPWPWEEGI
ncbi:spore coat protein CotJB [Mycoplasmatota bacterium WC44]